MKYKRNSNFELKEIAGDSVLVARGKTAIDFSAVVLFVVVVMIFIDVIMRYVLNSPIPGQQELAEMGTVVVVYFGLPFATRLRRHVRVETIPGNFSVTARSILYGILDLVCCAFLVMCAIKVFQQAGKLSLTPGNATLILRIPNFYIYYVASVGAILSAVEFLLDAIRYFIEGSMAKGKKTEKGANA